MTTSSFARTGFETQACLIVSGEQQQQQLSTAHFPRDVSQLERAELEEIYRRLRYHYRGVMISRGIHRSRCHRQASQLQDLGNRLRSMALEQASERTQVYAVLEQITDLAQALEADGDGLADSYQAFRHGGHGYGGAPRIAGLIQAVIQFINNWQRHKQAFRQLIVGQKVQATLAAAAESLR